MQDLNDKVTNDTLTANEWNQVPSEIQNVIEKTGQTLSGADLDQLGKGIANYVANGIFYTDTGAADAYVLGPVDSKLGPTAYTDGLRIAFVAGNPNSGSGGVTVNVNSLGVKSVKDILGNDPAAAVISSSTITEAYYNVAAGYFILTTNAPEKVIASIDASVASNALTVTINPGYIDFRSATLADGTVDRLAVTSPITLTVSSGSTLGTINAVPARLAILAINNAGTPEVAISNLAGGINLDETTLISTTAEGGAGGADSASVVYSTTARANVPFRVRGFIDITEATAGTWATGPTTIQGAGGNAATAMQSIGYGQTWQDLTGSRVSGTTYYNTTGKPIQVAITQGSTSSGSQNVVINGVTIISHAVSAISDRLVSTFDVPPGAAYSVTISGSPFVIWAELR